MHIQYRGYDLYYCHYKESRALPSVKCFAESQKSDTRQRASLPSAALGKELLCRVPHSAKHGSRQRARSLPSAKHSAQHGTRHRWSLPSVGLSAKHDTRQRLTVVHTVSLCRAPEVGHSTQMVFAECQDFGTRQSFFFWFFVSKFFLLTLHFILKPKLKFGTILDIFHIYI